MKSTFLGPAKGCLLSREFWQSLSVEQRTEIKVRITDERFKHLYPCPRHNGNWIRKTDCGYCPQAVRE